MTRPLITVLSAMLLTYGCAQHRTSTATSDPASSGWPATSSTRTSSASPSTSRVSTSAARGTVERTAGADATTIGRSETASAVQRTALAPEDYRRVSAIRDVHFDFDRYDIRGDQARILDENAVWLRANPGALVLIEGHADERGTDEYNLALGERRATSARNYLVAQGVASERIAVLSYGEERPACREHTEACWSQNRWAHLLVKTE